MIILAAITVLASCIRDAGSEQSIGLLCEFDGPVAEFAAEECDYLCQMAAIEYTEADDAGTVLVLKIHADMPEYAFAVKASEEDGKLKVELTGHDQTAALHAFYTFFEAGGFLFDITGPVAPEEFNREAVGQLDETINPVVKKRGIRQHINFPMDISSYTPDEAKGYLRNLARMRFNHISWHSYPNQWVEVLNDSIEEYAGFFFYGQDFAIPDMDVFRENVDNEAYYCIPHIEPYYTDTVRRSQMAVAWLQEMMAYAKSLGFTNQFSFEPREMSSDLGRTLVFADIILSTYPDIDILEVITEENCDGRLMPLDDMMDTLRAIYGGDFVDSAPLDHPSAHTQMTVRQLFIQFGHNVLAIEKMKEELSYDVQYSAGIYTTYAPRLKPLMYAVRNFKPKDLPLALLPGHGSTRASNCIEEVGFTAEDWDNTLMYSWIEFDGLIYLQQNTLDGIARMIELAMEARGEGSVPGIVYNHWRTAENRTVARYAAVSAIEGPVDIQAFYKDYAKRLGVDEEAFGAYAQAMEMLQDATWRSTNELPNIGFCFGNSRIGDPGAPMGRFSWWDINDLVEIRKMYEQAAELLSKALTKSPGKEAKAYLAFLINRTECTVLFLDAMMKGMELKPFCSVKGDVPDLTEEQKDEVHQKSREARELNMAYIRKHAEMMPDRGCEGTMMNFYYSTQSIWNSMEEVYTGKQTGNVLEKKEGDAPPPPISDEED